MRTTLGVLGHSLSLSDRIVHWVVQSRLASKLLLPRNWVVVTMMLLVPLIAWAAGPDATAWTVAKDVAMWSGGLWVIGQVATTLLSIYVAKRWVFIPRPTKGAPLTSEPLVMVRRNTTRASWSTTRLKPPQVVRWDILGVATSFLFGKLTSIPLWRPLRAPLFSLWSKMFKANLDEVERPLDEYHSLQEYFTRHLRPGLRPLAPATLVSPVDGTVVVCGPVESDRVEQVKGVTYSLSQFLGQDSATLMELSEFPQDEMDAHDDAPSLPQEVLAAEQVGDDDVAAEASEMMSGSDGYDSGGSLLSFTSPGDTLLTVIPESEIHVDGTPDKPDLSEPNTQLYHIVMYLAPGDYHRVHCPANVNFSNLRHFPGTLFPISPLIARLIPDLFSLNERVVMTGDWDYGFFSQTLVGAYNVGSIQIHFDSETKTNRLLRDFRCPNLELFSFGGVGCFAYDRSYESPIGLAKGEELGLFNLGSTVVLVFEAPVDFEFTVGAGDKVRMGQAIGMTRDDAARAE